MESHEVDLGKYKRVEDWRRDNAPDVFPTHGSWAWFRRGHRRELVECGALIERTGRGGSLVHIDRIGPVVQKILREESIRRLNVASAAVA